MDESDPGCNERSALWSWAQAIIIHKRYPKVREEAALYQSGGGTLLHGAGRIGGRRPLRC